MILRIYTAFHVVISLLGILAGFVVMAGMITANPLSGWTDFFFPVKRLMPAHLAGSWRWIYVATAVVAWGTLAGLRFHV
jgi:hypothetical protein